ncbi:MAG: molybdate ABC transporter permease subunit [Betaproteobacteria bacterium]|jgi:molybdate transport system permease protein|nr:molybdate ABC transporter permease subunit [Betaproteobacteria bacterium]MDH4294382.1 molybdate ABC transporter permease subunit [Betaproteobacteria bacterium]MDH5342424.1 molybdate ABC transporter permease subunit [Betaproteobacteria bacterium]
MDWSALSLSLKLAAWTVLILLPLGIWVGHFLAANRFRGRAWVEALLALPLVLPPTVLGYYLLVAMGGASPLGQMYETVFGRPLVFSFEGLLVASVIFNIPFAIQPMQRGFEAIAPEVRDAAACCGLSRWRTLWRIELPLAWPGILSAMVLTFAHTLGEFGVVLMVGGSIPGETKTVAIAIYDRVQAFDTAGAGIMSAALLLISLVAIGFAYFTTARSRTQRHG